MLKPGGKQALLLAYGFLFCAASLWSHDEAFFLLLGVFQALGFWAHVMMSDASERGGRK